MSNRKLQIVMAAGALVLSAAPPRAGGDTLEVSVHPITSTDTGWATTPTIGFDGLSLVVVYTRVDEGTLLGDIYTQRITPDGAPMGSAERVSASRTDDRLNDISGSYIVYTALEPDDLSQGIVKLYDVGNASTISLIPALDTVGVARIHGDIVAWVQGPEGASRVEMADLSSPMFAPITVSGSNWVFSVDVGSRYVVWDETDGISANIVAYDLRTGVQIPVATAADRNERSPKTYGDYVVWDESGTTTSSIWARNLTAGGAPFVVADPGAIVHHPSIDGDLIGYQSNQNGSFDLFIYRISDGTTHQVTDGPADEILSNISGNLMAFLEVVEGTEPWHTSPSPFDSLEISVAHLTFLPDPVDPCASLGGDADGDGVCTANDNCSDIANADQADADGDGVGDACDNCASLPNADQADGDTDGTGDVCEPPVADAGPDQSAHPGQTVDLDGSGSSHPAGLAISAYRWSLVSRPADSAAELASAEGITTAFTPDVPGDYVFALVVISATGIESAPDEVLVSTVNVPPVADAGDDVAVTLRGTTVTLDGSRSYDLEGDPITWSWILLQKPEASAAVLGDAATARPHFVADVAGEYLVELVVSDPWAPSAADTVLVSFTNLPPVASAGPNHTTVVAEAVVFDGTGSSDPNGDPLTYSWSLVSAPAGSVALLSNGSTAQAGLTPDLPGQYVVSLVVSDGLVDSPASNATLMAVSHATHATEDLNQAMTAINALDSAQLKNPSMRNALTNKIQAVLADIEAGNYADALAKLRNDVLKKTDGCAIAGAPDANDWIRDCAGQAQVYAILQDVIALLEEIV